MSDSHSQVLISKEEAARALGICVRSLDYLVQAKEIPVIRIGRRVLFRRESLEKFAAKRNK